jgi:hypothetical protein
MILTNQNLSSEKSINCGNGVNLELLSFGEYKERNYIPSFLKEIIYKSSGSYPVNKELKSLVIGKGGVCILANKNDSRPNILNMLKFARELFRLIKNDNETGLK